MRSLRVLNTNREIKNRRQSRYDFTKKGLSEFGKKVVARMNELGMMVDLSHPGEQTFWDVMKITKKPVLVSHSDTYTISPNFRNLKDDQIAAVGKNGGVIDLNFYSEFWIVLL